MGGSHSTHRSTPKHVAIGERIKSSVEDEINRRMMLQREVQMAINVAKARDMIQIYGSAWGTLVGGVGVAKMAGKPVPGMVGIPIVAGALVLGNMADMAYGNKLQRVAKEAEHIMEHERGRLVPMKQAPMAKYYTDREKGEMLDKATAAGMLWPSHMFSRK